MTSPSPKAITAVGLSLLLLGLLVYWVGPKGLEAAVQLSQAKQWVALLAAVALLLPNLGLEARKWRLALAREQKLSRRQSWLAILAGSTAAVLTPNRLGDYAARLSYLPPASRTRGGLLTFVCRFAQLVGLLFWAVILLVTSGLQQAWVWPLVFVLGLLCIASLGLLVGIARWGGRLWAYLPAASKRWAAKLLPSQESFTHAVLSLPQLGAVLLLATIRVAVYLAQYALLMYAFGAVAHPLLLLTAACLVFVAKAGLPSVALAELGIREVLAVSFAATLGLPEGALLSATLVLFLVNLLLPALLGIAPLQRQLRKLQLPAIKLARR